MKPIAAVTDGARRRSAGRHLGDGHRSLDEILAAAKARGKASAGLKGPAKSPKAIEAKLTAARAQLRAGRR